MKLSTSSLRKAILCFGTLLALYNLGPAPIRGDQYNIKPHTNLQPQDEKSLESEQNPVVKAQVGVSVAPKADHQMDSSGSGDADSVLAAAGRTGSHTDGGANQVLNAANQRLQADGSSHTWIWAILLVGGLLAGVFGVKRWADNNIPNAPTFAPKKGDNW